VTHRRIKGIRERGGREREREKARKRGIFGDEKRWMEGQHARGEKDVFLSQ